MNLMLRADSKSTDNPNPNPKEGGKNGKVVDLGNGSDIVYFPRFLTYEESWKYFDYLNKHIPWTRPTIRVFGRPFVQPRDVCYVAREGLTELTYSGYKPRAYSWDDFPPLNDILDDVQKAFPGSSFNTLLLNRYKGGNDYVGWHADDEKLYGPCPEIASISLGCERDFLLKKKPNKISQAKRLEGEAFEKAYKSERLEGEAPSKRAKKDVHLDQYSFNLKHGSLLLMRGFTQRDWVHSVPKRAKVESLRINLTFRRVL